MRRGLLLLLPAALLVAALAADPPAKASKVALLVGVNNYENTGLNSLHYAVQDMEELKSELEKAGYEVTLLTNQKATKAAIEAAVEELAKKRAQGGLFLLALSGHGMQTADKQGKEDAFFCPRDADKNHVETLVSLTGLVDSMGSRGVNVALVDACRDDPGRGVKGVQKVELGKLPNNTAVVFSCSPGQESFETNRMYGEGSADGHGVFFYHVLEGLRGKARDEDGEVTVYSLLPYLSKNVNARAKEWIDDKAQRKAKEDGVELKQLRFQVPNPLIKLQVDGVTLAAAVKVARPSPLDCTGEKGVSAAEVRKAQEAWAKYLGRKVEEEDAIAPGVKMKFVLVPAGKFLMGSPKDEQDRNDNEVQHEVELTRPFYLGVYDVTQAQYEAVTGKTPSKFQGTDLPVEQVSWEEADAFAKGLSEKAKEGLAYRLPTEAEWEYSGRGGRPSSLPFGIGDGTSLSSREANFNGDLPYGGAEKGPYLVKTTPVGGLVDAPYKPNALGLFDMHGNVFQWCGDWYGDYPTGKATDPLGPPKGSSRVDRGGSWVSGAGYCRAALRGRGPPGFRTGTLGFRLARVVQK